MSEKGLETVIMQKKLFFNMAKDTAEYVKNIVPSDEHLYGLRDGGADVFTFVERKWCYSVPNVPSTWARMEDNVALLHITNYQEWLRTVGKKTRNMIRKAEKSGIKTEIAVRNDKLAEGIWKIFNETPIRQERGFPHYGTSLETVKRSITPQENSTYIGAYFQNELAGFVHLIHGEEIAIISQILSLQKHWDKAVSNALVAQTVDTCAGRHIEWLMYGRIGNHPSLDTFKQNNGFQKFRLSRYYVPLTRKGKVAIKLGLHRDIKDSIPQSAKYPLIPIYNWISRTRMKMSVRPRQVT